MLGQVNSGQINIFVILVVCISSYCCINAGLIADLKHLNPTVIKKYSQNSPLFINIKSEGQHITGEVVHKLQAKPPPLTMKSMKLKKRFSRSIWPVPKLPLTPLLLPLIPPPPLLPLLPNWLSQPTLSALPISQDPIVKLSHLLGWTKRNAQIHEKLLELKHQGSLTTTEYIRFQKLLLRL